MVVVKIQLTFLFAMLHAFFDLSIDECAVDVIFANTLIFWDGLLSAIALFQYFRRDDTIVEVRLLVEQNESFWALQRYYLLFYL